MITMLRKALLAVAATGLIAGAAPAFADDHGHRGHRQAAGQDRGWHSEDYRGGGGYRGDRYGTSGGERYGYRGSGHQRVYRSERSYAGPVWRGRDGRSYCRRDDGTTGLLIGAAVGGVLGHEVAGQRGDRTLGAILGAAGGALLGRSLDRGDSRCR